MEFIINIVTAVNQSCTAVFKPPLSPCGNLTDQPGIKQVKRGATKALIMED